MHKSFPGPEGIFEADCDIADTYYLNEQDRRRYRFLRPAYEADHDNVIVISDCWIVDEHGEVNPGTNVSPVPFHISCLGRRINHE